VQRSLPGGVVLDAGYFGSKGTHLIGIVDINQAYPGAALAAGLHTGAGTIFTPTDTPRINAVRPIWVSTRLTQFCRHSIPITIRSR